MPETTYGFDRFLRYDEMSSWIDATVAAHPGLATVEQYGSSHEGRPLLLVTLTDSSTGDHSSKPAMWVDANIHSIEVTGGVAALHLIHHLLEGFTNGDAKVVEAMRTRTFYVVPRVNPDGVEAALADSPATGAAACARGPGPTAMNGRVSSPTTSTVTAGSSRCASPTRTGRGWSIPRTRAS